MLRQFIKNVSIYGLAPAFSKFVGFFLVPVYTRVFCPEEYGLIDLFQTFVYFLMILIELEIHSAVGRFFNQSRDRKILVSTAFWFQVGLSLLVVFPLLYFCNDINLLLTDNESYNKIFLLAIMWLPLNALAFYFTIVMRFENRPFVYIQIYILQTVVRVTVSLFSIFVLNLGISGIFIGHIAGDFTALCLLLYFLRKYIGIVADLSLLKKILAFSLPLCPAVFVFFCSEFISRLIMLKVLSLHSIGIFSVALKVASIFGMLEMAITMAWEPFVYSHLVCVDHKEQFVKIYKMIAVVVCLLVCIVALFSEEILSIITTKEYLSAASIVGILSISSVFRLLREVIGIGPKIVSKTIYDSVASVVGVAVSLLSMLLLVPQFGIVGAALALLLGSGVNLLVSWYYTEKLYPVGYPGLFTLLMIAVMFVTVFLSIFISVPLSFKVVAIFCIFLTLVYCRDVVKEVINSPLK